MLIAQHYHSAHASANAKVIKNPCRTMRAARVVPGDDLNLRQLDYFVKRIFSKP